MKAAVIVIIVVILSSCTKSITYYTYEGTTVSRVDHSDAVYLFRGKIKNENVELPHIKAEYHGFNSAVDAYLLFKEDATVEVIDGGLGHFTESGNANSQIYYREYDMDSLLKANKGVMPNLIRISSALDFEKRRNRETFSEVNVQYP